MTDMTREEFLEKAIVGAAAIALIPESNLTATLEKMKGKDFIVIAMIRDGKHYGLGWELTGDEEHDLNGMKWLRRSMEIQYLHGDEPLYDGKIWSNI